MLTVDFAQFRIDPSCLVLDLGTGFGRHAFEVARRGAQLVAVDAASEELRDTLATLEAMRESGELSENAAQADVLQCDATALPFRSETFDRIIAAEILEHIPNDLGALQELWRVLKPGGRIAVTVPAALPEQICWWLNDGYHAPAVPGGHVRIYSKAELHTKLTSVGFEPGGNHRAHALHSPYWWLKCLVGLENDSNPAVKAYHKLLTWDIVARPRATQLAEQLLNPLLGKSLVQYAAKPASVGSLAGGPDA